MVSAGSIGVIIAAHDAGRLLGATLASVAAQSLLPDEVVVADDASTDDTVAIARSWADRLPVTVVEQRTNVGCGPTRAAGVAVMQTDRVAVLDADDIWLPDHLEHLARLHDAHGGVVCPLAFDWWPAVRLRERAWRVPVQDQFAELVQRNRLFSGALYFREDHDRAGGYRDRLLVEDWDLWLRMAAQGVTFSEGTVPTVLYRRHSDNVTRQHMRVLEAAHRLIHELAADGIVPLEHARRSLRSTEAEMALQRSAELYDAGRVWRARAALLGGLRGRPRLKLGTTAALLAPPSVSARLARRGYPGVQPTPPVPARQ